MEDFKDVADIPWMQLPNEQDPYQTPITLAFSQQEANENNNS